MKVQELRDAIRKYNVEEKDKIIVELYKKIPKYVKEENNIDNFILNVNAKVEKKEKIESFEELESEITYFLDCVWEGLYYKPNKIISKDERSKWRFKVMKYYKALSKIPVNSENGGLATDLLKKIYVMLSFGSVSLLFSNWNTFRAIQVPQEEFYKNIIDRKFQNGISKESLEYCIDLLESDFDPQGYYKYVFNALEISLVTADSKRLAIELLIEKVNKWKEKYKEKDSYDNEKTLNYFVEFVVRLYFDLGEIPLGIAFYQKHYIYKNKEIKEYILLEMIEKYEFYEEWIQEYEKHLGKISYRDSLKEKYKNFTKKSN